MKQIYAPWRMKFIKGRKPRGCPFCRIAGSKDDEKHNVLKRRKFCYSVLNLYPYNNGHLMVIPYRHVDCLGDLDSAALVEMTEELRYWTLKLGRELKPEGFNIGMNLGRAGGAGIEKHIHFHVVPRWNGDTNFMSVLGDVKVIPESLSSVFRKLKMK